MFGMQFNIANEYIAVATNALKEVRIVRSVDTENFDRNVWMTITPEGRLDDGVTADGPFNSFDEAKRNAETYVGFTVKDFGKILASA